MGLGNDPTARILKLKPAVADTPTTFGLGNDPTARILKRYAISAVDVVFVAGLGNDPTARILKPRRRTNVHTAAQAV